MMKNQKFSLIIADNLVRNSDNTQLLLNNENKISQYSIFNVYTHRLHLFTVENLQKFYDT